MRDKIYEKLDNIDAIEPAFEKNCIPITFSSSEYFAPYLGVALQSLVDFSNEENNYDILVFTRDMTEFSKIELKNLLPKKNFSIRFIDLNGVFGELNLYVTGHVSIETYFRLIIPHFMVKYKKFLFLDAGGRDSTI